MPQLAGNLGGLAKMTLPSFSEYGFWMIWALVASTVWIALSSWPRAAREPVAPGKRRWANCPTTAAALAEFLHTSPVLFTMEAELSQALGVAIAGFEIDLLRAEEQARALGIADIETLER